MKQRECKGILEYHTGRSVDATLISFSNKTNNWFQARGKLLLSIGPLVPHGPGKWQVGSFICKKEEHLPHNDNFLLTATDNGRIEKDEHTKFETLVLDVSIVRMSVDKKNSLHRPRIYRYDE